MTILTKALLALVAVLLLAVGIQTWRVSAHKNDAIEAAVAPAKQAAATATAKVESVTVQLAGRIDTVARRIHDTVTVPANVLHPVTPQDTASAVATLPIVKAERDSIAKACTELVTVSNAHVTACQVQHRADSTLNATLEALVKSRPAKRYWHVGVGPSYTAVVVGGRITNGFGLSVGYYWTPF